MRAFGTLLACAGLLAACNNEPDFDERFDTAQAEIEKTAESIEEDLNADDKGSVQAEPTANPTDTDPR